jgi:hypothetical protein
MRTVRIRLIHLHSSVRINGMLSKFLQFLWLLLSLEASGAPIRVVFIDSETERLYGSWPLGHAIMARGMDQIRTAGAKAIVLKFFYDEAKGHDDTVLAASIRSIPCALEACMQTNEPRSNPLPDRFCLTTPAYHDWMTGNSGWLPAPIFAVGAQKMGFVDFRTVDSAPLLECYQGHTVDSLYCCALEFVTGETANFDHTNRVFFGRKYLELDSGAESPVTLPRSDKLDYIPFHELLGEKRDTWTPKLAGAVVILGYDGDQIHSFPSKIGNIKAHRLFVYQLESLYQNLKSVN